MFGWPRNLPGRTRPVELGIRVLVMSALLLPALYACQRPLVLRMVPLLCSAMQLGSPEFKVTSAELARAGPSEVLRVRANLSMPIDFAGRILYPFGWNGVVPPGGFEVSVTLGAVLQYPALTLILVLAWPAARASEWLARLALAAPAVPLLLLRSSHIRCRCHHKFNWVSQKECTVAATCA